MLVVTTDRIYNFKKQKVKRFININKLGGISKTTSSGSKNEFTVHVPSEYDYRFICDRREEVIDILK
jgi:intein-encoded DNA endonuclease-like protein